MVDEQVDRRLIEDVFPIEEISVESVRERSVRQGHISTLHVWWARRPLAASRAVCYAALIPSPLDSAQAQREKEFIVKLSRWENSLNKSLIEEARKSVRTANNGRSPKVLDPFAGGGSIPLEALRLGCETYASDYNPVATLLLKCTLEYPQKYRAVDTDIQRSQITSGDGGRLLDDVREWGNKVLKESQKEVGSFYPAEKDGSIPVGYVWARTIPCQNPSCGAEIPLVRRYWLAKHGKRKITLHPSVVGKDIEFDILGAGYGDFIEDFDPDKGTIHKAIATCPVCGSAVDGKTTRRLFAEGRNGQRLLAVITRKGGVVGKRYRIASDSDRVDFDRAETYLRSKQEKLADAWGMDPIPREEAPGTTSSQGPRFHYGFLTFGDYFNTRQKSALITFVEKVRDSYNEMIERGYDRDYAKAVTTYLAMICDRLVDKDASIVTYDITLEKIEHVFGRQAIQMVWDYVEVNPFTEVGWSNMQDWVEGVIKHCLSIPRVSDCGLQTPSVGMYSATDLPYPDGSFDAVLTDPPYYDNVSYALLSDFFYVWLKRTIGDLYPELFVTALTPKTDQAIADRHRWKTEGEAKQCYEDRLKESFREIFRVTRPGGIVVIVFAHKSTAAWETLVNALMESGLVITAAWPIHTEMNVRMVAKGSAALASSIYIVARKSGQEEFGLYKDIKDEMREFLNTRMEKLWRDGISGADFIVAAMGSSIQVFGKYKQIIRENTSVTADVMLDDVRKIVTDYAIRQVLHNGFASEISALTRFYLLWRWAYGDASVIFDDARKLAQGTGIDLVDVWNKGFVRKDKEMISVLGPQQRRLTEIESLDTKDMIDVMHEGLLLWEKGDRAALIDLLKETGYGSKDAFYRVAQAISESLPSGTKEKQLLDGFLSGRVRLGDEIAKSGKQTRLFE